MAELASLQIAVDSRGAVTGVNNLQKLEKQGRKTESAAHSLGSTFKGALAQIGAAVSVAATVKKLVEVSREFDVINASLITATGSAENAKIAFDAIREFASQTPYDLQQASKAFVQLVNLGLDPSERALNAYGNTASAMGKDLSQMVEAVADATTGEFERLKEFGIKSRSEGDKVSFTFRGVTTTVGKNAAEIEQYLQRLGEVEFAGAMAERAKTLDGALSNLGDTWDGLFRTISQQGVGTAIHDAVTLAEERLSDLTEFVSSGELNDLFAPIVDSLKAIPWEHTADAAKALALIIGARLGGAALTSAASMTAATVQTIRYQAALARLAGVSKTAAVGVTALGAAARTASAGLAFLGGPAGALLLAAGAVYTFGMRADDAVSKVDLLTESVNDLNDATLRLRRTQLTDKITELESAGGVAMAAGASVEYLKKQLEQFPHSPKADEWRRRLEEQEAAAANAGEELERYRQRLAEIDNTLANRKAGIRPDPKPKDEGVLGQFGLGAAEPSSEGATDGDRLNSLQLGLDQELAFIQMAQTEKGELERQSHQARMEFIQQAKEEQLVTEQEANVMMLEEALRYQGAYTQILAEEARNREQIEEEELRDRQRRLQATQQMLSNFSTLMNSQSKKLFEAGKVAAIANALLSAKESVVDAYKWGTKIGGPVLGSVFAAAAATATAVQVQQIKSQQFGGGSTVSASGGTPGTYQPPQPTQPYGPQERNQGQAVQVIFNGPVNGIDAQHITDTIKDAVNNSDFILIETTSRNGQMLAGR